MMYPTYVVPAGATLPILFSTYNVTNGASITLTGLAVTDIEIYKDGSTAQRASDSGYSLLDTDGIDFDGITGIHGVSINTGDGTTSGFWTIGSWYHVVISSVTVNAQTVNLIIAAFRLAPPENVVGYPVADTSKWAGDDIPNPAVPGIPEVDVSHHRHTEVEVPRIPGVPIVDPGYVIGAGLEEDSEVSTNWGAK